MNIDLSMIREKDRYWNYLPGMSIKFGYKIGCSEFEIQLILGKDSPVQKALLEGLEQIIEKDKEFKKLYTIDSAFSIYLIKVDPEQYGLSANWCFSGTVYLLENEEDIESGRLVYILMLTEDSAGKLKNVIESLLPQIKKRKSFLSSEKRSTHFFLKFDHVTQYSLGLQGDICHPVKLYPSWRHFNRNNGGKEHDYWDYYLPLRERLLKEIGSRCICHEEMDYLNYIPDAFLNESGNLHYYEDMALEEE